ncbi:hypothetical protein, partial [Streptococcus pluranimalium]
RGVFLPVVVENTLFQFLGQGDGPNRFSSVFIENPVRGISPIVLLKSSLTDLVSNKTTCNFVCKSGRGCSK